MFPNVSSWHPPAERTVADALPLSTTQRFLVSPSVYQPKRRKQDEPGWYLVDTDGRSNLWLTAAPASEWTSTSVLACLREMRTFYGPHVRDQASITVEGPNWHGGYKVRFTVTEPLGSRRLSLSLGDDRVGHESAALAVSTRFWLEHLKSTGPLQLSTCGTQLVPVAAEGGAR